MHGSSMPKVIRGCQQLKQPPRRAVLTIGNFDGVHRGHQHIIKGLVDRAQALDGTAALLTFDPPPSRVVGKKRFIPQISSIEDRQWLCEQLGLPIFVVQSFTPDLAALSPEAFVSDIIEQHFDPAELWVGYDFAFGKNRAGNFAFLRDYFADKPCQVSQIEAVRGSFDTIISSTRVRAAVLGGEVEQATAYLGRPHFIRGTVEHGDKRGRTIGFPTANLKVQTELLPQSGVYATWCSIEGKTYASITNIGTRPTVDGSDLRVECHVFDFDRAIYDVEMTLWFERRLRPEMRFEDFEHLREQIVRDAKEARAALALTPAPAMIANSTLP